MKIKIIAVFVAFTLAFTTVLTAKICKICVSTCVHTQIIVQTAAETTETLESSCIPNNHNWQEYALTSEKIYEVENPADYMGGLTAISKRCIYVGEADYLRLDVKRNM